MLVVTGKGLKIVTPRDTITARDSLEWYDTQQIGVARGDAVAMRGDRIVRGDVLTAQVAEDSQTAPRTSAASTRMATWSCPRPARSRAATPASIISTPASPRSPATSA